MVKRSSLAAIGLAIALSACNQEQHDYTRVTWFDDFIGSSLHPAYSYVPTQREFIYAVDGIGGWIGLTAEAPAYNARVRLGDDPRDTAGVHQNMPFIHSQRTVGRTRVIMSDDRNVDATIGFVGPDDPNGVGGALLYRSEGDQTGWQLQTCRDGECAIAHTGFVHTIGEPFTVEIRLAPDRVEAFIDGKRVATLRDQIPVGGAAWEYQIWGHTTADGQSTQPTMLIDYLSISQRR